MVFLRSFARIVFFVLRRFSLAAALAALHAANAQVALSRVPPRVPSAVDDSRRVTLHGNVHPSLQQGAAQYITDQGAVEDSFQAGRMLLLLKRSPDQEAALQDFIQAAHSPGNPAYRQWLKPEEFGRLYGPADSDLAAVTAWLESHGLMINKLHSGRLAIEFSGTAGQMREAFHTGIHRYLLQGETHLANAAEPAVPAALAPVIAGLVPINDFHPRPQLRVLGRAEFDPKTHQAAPQWSYPTGKAVNYVVAPGDLAMQYDINPVYKSGINGTGQSIAIVSASNVDLTLVQAYQALFGLSVNLPQVVVDGTDPGQNYAATEAYLDLELANSVAPGARVVLYTSGGTALASGLALAALRAVEDDLAGVISVSYGECELELGQGGNAFWNALWQQAAAQGQTVFVSSGDAGSAGCDNFDVQSMAYSGLQVNGIASTPYNVAVGGTDFYYSQNGGSTSAVGTQLAAYWSGSTTSPGVSLKQPVPEQAWNDFFGFNLTDGGKPANQISQTILAGGGGTSKSAVFGASGAAGYAKPAWQTGTGVPADKVRDLPDLSLFAANGYNLSFYPICANPGDCSSANKNQGGAIAVTGVGGTSASSPAMAAIQALVNQSTGHWAGQANFIYYPLAARQPSVFHDVIVGGNQVLCYQGTANCAAGKSGTISSGYFVESGYAAGKGYDLATGLGSIDVANLVKYWNSITFLPTTTSLSLTPSSFVHGKTATITGTVVAASGTGTPTGAVSLTANDGLSHYTGIGDFPLVAGRVNALVDNLPGGTYQLTAVYSGDALFASSKSAPVTVTVTPEKNTLAASGWAWNPYDLYLYPLSSGMTIPYGAQIYLDAQPISGNATIATQLTAATGTVAFTDKSGAATVASTQPLNAAGVAEWSTGVFAPGSHTVSASYSGDASYLASTAAAASFTVIPGSTNLVVGPLAATVAAGAKVTIDVQLSTGYLPLYGKLPTGSVTVKLGSQSQTVAWQPYGPTGNARLEAAATFTGVPAGILPVSASYAGDANWLGSAANGGTVIALSSKLTPTVTFTSSSASPSPGQTLTLTAKVAGPSGKPAPTGTVAFVTNDQAFYSMASISSGTALLTLPAWNLPNGVSIITALYPGDSNYTAATSSALNITVAKPDFSFTTLNPKLPIAPSSSGTITLALAPINGFSGTVTLTSSAQAGITVKPATASPTVSAAITDAVTISVASSLAPGVCPVSIIATGGGHTHTAQILVAVMVVAAPVFSPAAGTYASAQQVTITDAAPGAAIYYTINGTTPTTGSTRYSGAIAVKATQTLQALAVASGYPPSAVATAKYTIAVPAATPTFSPAAGSYTSAQTVAISSATPGATIYYTTNGSTPTASSIRYIATFKVSATQTIKAIAIAFGYSQSAVATAVYTLGKSAASPARPARLPRQSLSPLTATASPRAGCGGSSESINPYLPPRPFPMEITSSLTGTIPDLVMASFSAAPYERSMMRPSYR